MKLIGMTEEYIYVAPSASYHDFLLVAIVDTRKKKGSREG